MGESMVHQWANEWRIGGVSMGESMGESVAFQWAKIRLANEWGRCLCFVSLSQVCNSNNTKNSIIVSLIRQVKNRLMNRTLKQKERLSSCINAHQVATVVH